MPFPNEYWQSRQEQIEAYANYMGNLVFKSTGCRIKAGKARMRVLNGEHLPDENDNGQDWHFDDW